MTTSTSSARQDRRPKENPRSGAQSSGDERKGSHTRAHTRVCKTLPSVAMAAVFKQITQSVDTKETREKSIHVVTVQPGTTWRSQAGSGRAKKGHTAL